LALPAKATDISWNSSARSITAYRDYLGSD
jgi:hypothetical protein